MHEPGWYPDPEGTQGRFRWWDGQQWSDEIRDDPHSGLDAILDADALRAWVEAARSCGAVLASDECYGEFAWDAPAFSVLDPAINGGTLDGLLAA